MAHYTLLFFVLINRGTVCFKPSHFSILIGLDD
nr:MAG TPA: hypothetical protein [Caudoviricetes sp.]